ncbi:MAG: hypothetical protein K0R54_2584 [Clostridiaceae bacterium]|jgi:capsular polysaccharide biosynthesis protein|nr:hypothetical protein [Clostridiaceae bacterium]
MNYIIKKRKLLFIISIIFIITIIYFKFGKKPIYHNYDAIIYNNSNHEYIEKCEITIKGRDMLTSGYYLMMDMR